MPFTPYLNVEEIESALEEAAATWPALCQLITLPNATFEGRTSHVLRIAGGPMMDRKGILLIGCVHAREWGSSDILVSFAEQLLAMYDAGLGLPFQGKSYSAADIQRIVETLEIFIFPDVNPDGKAFSQSGHDWRKNRRPVAGDLGVDLNRNYDFLWDANLYFDPSLDFSYLYSPSSPNYHGLSPFSEAEAQNVRWLLDSWPQIGCFVDLHCCGQKIMYIWGDDENQTEDTGKSFFNPAWNGARGLSGGTYGEFIFADDHQKQLRVAQRMRDALFLVRGKSYMCGQIFHQVGVSACDSAPYAYSRHIIQPTRQKIFSFGIEWGQTFQPEPTEMLAIMDDVGAAITELCLCMAEPDLYVRDNLADIGREPSTGSLSMSPDIIVRKDPVLDPATAFADASVDPGSDKVEIGNDNYIYVRVHNRGGLSADAAVRVYQAPLTTSCVPSAWTFIDEEDVPAVPPGSLAVAGPIVWPHVTDPGTAGHFCLVALVGNALDPFPDPALVGSAADFMRWMRNGNNQAYRNIVLENARPDGWAVIPFLVHGFGKRGEIYELAFDTTGIPRGSRVELQALPRVPKGLKARHMEALKRNPRGTHFLVRAGRVGALEGLRVSGVRALRFAVHVWISPTEGTDVTAMLGVVQKWQSREIGHISIHLRHKPTHES